MSRMEKLIGSVLLIGVLLCAVIVLTGGTVYLWRHGAAHVHYRVFRGEPSDLRTLAGILGDVGSMSGRGIIQMGLMLLVGVQVVRVALTALLFVLSRDRAFAAISVLVLGLLTYGLVVQGG